MTAEPLAVNCNRAKFLGKKLWHQSTKTLHYCYLMAVPPKIAFHPRIISGTAPRPITNSLAAPGTSWCEFEHGAPRCNSLWLHPSKNIIKAFLLFWWASTSLFWSEPILNHSGCHYPHCHSLSNSLSLLIILLIITAMRHSKQLHHVCYLSM